MTSKALLRFAASVMMAATTTAFVTSPANAQVRESVSAPGSECDRNCLGGLMTSYIDALVARDPSRLNLPEGVRFTEDSQAMEVGGGLWQTVSGRGDFRQDYIDTDRQIAASHVELLEGELPVLYSVLLHVENGSIAGIETLVQRITPDFPFQPTELGGPIQGFDDPVPEGLRQSRQSMIALALTYTEGLRVGNFTDAGTPFSADAYRVENGVVTAGEGCGRNDCDMYAQNLFLHPEIIASVAAVDEENGVVLLWMNFGNTGTYEPNHALVTFEAFKVYGSQIHSINAFFRTLPQARSRFWPSTDPIQPRSTYTRVSSSPESQ